MSELATVWPIALAVLGAVAFSSVLSALRSALAAASRPVRLSLADRPGLPRPPPLRARVLGALLVGSIVLTVAAATLAAHVFGERGGGTGVAWAAVTVAALVIGGEAAARLDGVQAAIGRALAPLGFRLDRYARLLSASDEIRGQVDRLHERGEVVKEDVDMLGGLLDLKDLTVSAVMVHRTKIRMLDADLPPRDLLREVLASPNTRMPLWRGSPDNIVGVLHAKDLLRAVGLGGMPPSGLDVEKLATLPWFVPDTTTLRDQLRAFLARRRHVAIVVDEYGDVMGLLTLEDILEEIVGEISDEHDVAARGVRPQRDGSVLADGSVPIRDLNRAMGWDLPDEEATTVAGLVIHEAMLIPEAGQVFEFHGFRFEVLRRIRNRVAALRVSPVQRAAAGSEKRSR